MGLDGSLKHVKEVENEKGIFEGKRRFIDGRRGRELHDLERNSHIGGANVQT
jgi:hypothetical protein